MIPRRIAFYGLLTVVFFAALWAARPEDAAAFFSGWILWREPVVAGMVCGALSAFLGVYMLCNRIVFVSLAVAQGAGLGIFCAFFVAGLWGLHIEDSPVSLLSGFAFAAGSAFLFSRVRGRTPHIPDESLIGLLYAFSAGFIVLIGDRVAEGRHHIDNLLFGNAVAVTADDLNLLGIAAVGIFFAHYAFRREFLYSSADADFTRIAGVNARFWQTLLDLTLTLGITVSLKTLGSIPVFAMMTVPPYLALREARGLHDAFMSALFLGLVIPPMGYFFSYLYAFPAGASVTAVAAAYFLAGLGESRLPGIRARENILPAPAPAAGPASE